MSPSSLLEVVEQVDDLGLDGDVERRHRLVEQHQPRPHGERAGEADALALAARELVRVAVQVLRPEADLLEQLAHALLRLLARARRGGAAASAMICATLLRGFSDA